MTDKVQIADKVLASSAETSPDALLKQAILGARASAEKAAATPKAVARAPFRLDPRLAGFSLAGLGLGALLGAGAMGLASPSGGANTEALGQVRHQIEAMRTESERQIEGLTKNLAQLQESADAARSEAKSRTTALSERLGRTEQTLGTKIAAMGEKLELAEKDQTARLAALTTQIEKRPVAATTPAPQAMKAVAPEPTETGALSDKPKPAPTENWAVRDVYDGIAVLEDRKRRLVEVGPGDTVPGVGRIEAIERRGKSWVVVTKQGPITPQAW